MAWMHEQKSLLLITPSAHVGVDHCVRRIPITPQLITAAPSDRHHVGRRLDQNRARHRVAIWAISQLLDVELFREFFDGHAERL